MLHFTYCKVHYRIDDKAIDRIHQPRDQEGVSSNTPK